MATNSGRRNVPITDLDHSDNQQQTALEESHHRKVVHKKRSKEKHLQTLAGNFSRRSQSAECKKPEERLPEGGGVGGLVDKTNKNNAKHVSYFHDLVSDIEKSKPVSVG